jgi:hypothetical protein
MNLRHRGYLVEGKGKTAKDLPENLLAKVKMVTRSLMSDPQKGRLVKDMINPPLLSVPGKKMFLPYLKQALNDVTVRVALQVANKGKADSAWMKKMLSAVFKRHDIPTKEQEKMLAMVADYFRKGLA